MSDPPDKEEQSLYSLDFKFCRVRWFVLGELGGSYWVGGVYHNKTLLNRIELELGLVRSWQKSL